MTISEALAELETCDWLKITDTHVSASRWKTREERAMLSPEDREDRNSFYQSHVLTRRRKTESFEQLLIRAAEMVRAGHVPDPARRRPPLSNEERCACGASSHLSWDRQLKQHLCRKCQAAWENAANHNDMPAAGKVEH